MEVEDSQHIFTHVKRILNNHSSLLDAYSLLEPIILNMFGATRMSIFQRRRQHQDLVARFKTGKETLEIKVPISPMSIAGYVAISQLPLLIADPYNAAELKAIHPRLRFADKFDKDNDFKTTNILCVPILNAGVLMGVMQIINKQNGSFDDNDLARANDLALVLGAKFRYELGGTNNPFDSLLHKGLINEPALKALLSTSKDTRTIVQGLMSEHRVPEHEIGHSLSIHYQVPFIGYLPDKYHRYEGESKLNLSYLKRNHVAVISDVEGNPIVLMAEPNNAALLMETESALGIESYEIAVGLPHHILQYLGEGGGGAAPGDMNEILDEIGLSSEENDELVDELSDDAPAVVRLVSRVLHDAKRLGASDIHIDPEKNAPTRVRMRVDGVCRDMNKVPNSHHNAVIARIKIMSNLNIAEKRVPQDGKLAFKMNGQLVEVRVATIPTVAGEGVVMRLLASGGAMPIEKMNLAPTNLKRLEDMIKKPHGILLVVGPTGSGKTTTLHAILGYLNTPEKKIWTAEDPVEITQPGLQQVQVSPKIGFTFANALRAFLRADPDIILIGEMRDKETAHAGIEASLTGHLVLSTLHTNSAPETITRLLDLGLDPVNFSDACVGILAQRLIRTLCGKCKEEYVASDTDMAFIERQYGAQMLDELALPSPLKLHRAKGCEECGNTGYKGRTGVHELLGMTPELRSLVYKEASVSEMKKQATQDGMRTLVQDAIFKVIKGDTDIPQVQIVGGD
ncbi:MULTISPECIES: GspE/PulE family protein [Alteromonas]|jgi:type II secretory ATPase GspE/PulE/Tfp pilus assembly ATPase PilB-like protein|uniref:ATPase, T2SS/T4P/T4SS family n=2 Tax=Alteromonas stellipolaris TaxID=233316 RepID=A0AAW7Z096_9ALTE|nr:MULTISPECIES: ATPase, T2SS/T4P/T4SS family [Alteromonas]ALM92165.1 Type II secretory pathway, ATPase PulE/Tfp pilus assembly pathway, ATPase PilB [Alteromonas stellipolaris LMG 21856]MBZ2160509.1 Flp pilus assembly complex ATPase component TadA [Alteromonas stellipolaris]MDO6535911.1 ATPase, T2SS/T4P/T4SS family [Alteromonas stellipolaris]MDO6539451.1 ATPase, T2SS/T4P/T4SS family [Alteromonas stellipolaris]MDO6578149.1 ATPase, T2SS/T4P/T4SS family [Alteromonas stellipolaris]